MPRDAFAQDQPVLLTAQRSEREDDCACADTVLLCEQVGSENDCACAMPDQLAPTSLDRVYQRAEVYTASLPQGFHLALGRHGPCVLNDSVWESWQSFDLPRPVQTSLERSLAVEGLLLAPQTVLSRARPHTLTAWLHITNRCNLACPYCYVHTSTASMSRETARRSVETLLQDAQQGGFSGLKIKYAGGEASLEFALVQETHAYARTLAKEYDLALSGTLLSNGTRLTGEQAIWIADQSMRVMISLDGIGLAHDALRKTHGGAGTFHLVEHTVDTVLLPRGIRPYISMTLTGQNAGAAPEVARWSIERGLPLSFNFYRHTGAPRSDGLKLDSQIVLAGMEAAYRVFEELLPEYPFLNGLLDRFQVGAHEHTCGVGSTYRVIGHDGKVAACHMLLGKTGEQALVQNLDVAQKQQCKDCAFASFCAGGCPLETHRATGAWDQPSPHCDLYRRLIPQALRLEGLRLLKTNGYLL